MRRNNKGPPVVITGDMWSMLGDYDAVGITTNGEVNSWGEAVMGAGTAKVAARRWSPWLSEFLGASISRFGNHVHVYDNEPPPKFIFSFPTKHRARDRQSDIDLICQSAEELMIAADKHRWSKVLLPQPGTGMGRLSWSDVWKMVAPIMDGRIHIVSPSPSNPADLSL
jgi:hypothetical protein